MRSLTDVHCHILPAVDDGAPSLKESITMLRAEQADGVDRVILTPHCRRHMFETPREVILHRFSVLREKARELVPGIRLYLGCEFHVLRDMAEIVTRDASYRMAGSDAVLTEFSGADEAVFFRKTVGELRSYGLVPIIAHVERYEVFAGDIGLAEDLKDMGAWLQVNAGSVLGGEGKQEKKVCLRLLKEGLVDLVGTDAHSMTYRPPRLGECAAWVEKKFGSSYADRIFLDRPRRIFSELSGNG